MKTFVFAALLVLASASALPQTHDVAEPRRDVVEAVLDLIKRMRQRIQDADWDPKVIKYVEGEYSLPIAGIFTARGSVTDLNINHLSNIVVTDIGFSLITGKLNFDLGIPIITATLGAAEGEVSFLGRPAHRGLASGRLAINNFNITGSVNVDMSGDKVVVSDLVVSARIGSISSGLHVNIIGYDVSSYVNNFLSRTLPTLLTNNSDYINRGIQWLIMYLLDLVL